MRCPQCREELVVLEVDGVELDVCVEHRGAWFDQQELGQLFARSAGAAALRELEQELEAVPRQRGRRRCPRCSGRLQEVSLPGAAGPALDRCPRGHGLWFDDGELQALASAALGDAHPALAEVRAYLDDFFPRSAEAAGA